MTIDQATTLKDKIDAAIEQAADPKEALRALGEAHKELIDLLSFPQA